MDLYPRIPIIYREQMIMQDELQQTDWVHTPKATPEMRVLVCGGREFDDWGLLINTLYNYYKDSLVQKKSFIIIEGGAKGADFLARVWAKHMNVPFKEFPADWKTYGKAAGAIRNKRMLEEGKPDLVVAFPGGFGTANMIEIATAAGIPVNRVLDRPQNAI